jgi:hypothetical protein
VLTGLLAGVLFLAAGTTHIATLRAYLAVFSALLLVTVLSVDPGLAQERTRPLLAGRTQERGLAPDFCFLLPWALRQRT